jgi:hypothetical protein
VARIVTTRFYPTVIRFRATEAHRERLERISRHYARSPSDVLRLLIVEADERLDTGKPDK